MKRVSVSVLSIFTVVCAVTAASMGGMLTPAQFPKNANDLTFGQRMDVLADDYESFDTVFDSNGVCIENCPYVGMTIEKFNQQIEQATQQVMQDVAELSQYSGSIQGTVVASDNGALTDFAYNNVPDAAIDAQIVNYLASKVYEQTGIDVNQNASVLHQIQDVATNARINLMSNASTDIDLNIVPDASSDVVRFSATLQRSEMPDYIKDWLDGTVNKSATSKPDVAKITNSLQSLVGNSAAQIPATCPLGNGTIKVSDEMKCRNKKTRRNHNGMDLAVPVGTPVYAAADGRVVIRKDNPGGYGYYLSIQHDKNYYTVYGHLSKWLVSDGQTVRAGQKIALSGNTGRSSGPHLHFEVLKNAPLVKDLGGIPVNPRIITKCTWKPQNSNSNIGNNRC